METLIAIFAFITAVFGSLLQLALIFEGLAIVSRTIFPFLSLSLEKATWFSLWGGWHLVVFALMFKFMHDAFMHDMDTYKSVYYQTEGIRILIMWLVLPLATSFALSRAHDLARKKIESHT